MELVGNIIAVLPAQSGTSQRSGNTWMSQEYVIEVPGSYPKRCVFRIFGEDRIKQFDLHQGEQNITVQFDIDAHEYNGRWFNEVRAYNVIRPYVQQPYQQPAQQNPFPQGQPVQQQAPFPPQQPAQPAATQDSDDLPF